MTNHSPKGEGTTLPVQSSDAQYSMIDVELPLSVVAEAAVISAATGFMQSSSSGAFETVVLLDPNKIAAGQMPHRSEDAYCDEDFENLLDSIEAAKGNTQPISVIPLPDHADAEYACQYEVVSGSRRVHACRALGLPVRAIVLNQPRTSSYQLDTIIENFHRSDPSPLEFGRQIQHLELIEPGLSLKRMERLFGRDKSVISRAKDLAALPLEVIQAFSSSSEIRYADGQLLKKALQANRDAVLEEAVRLGEMTDKLKASEVVQHLVEAAKTGGGLEADKVAANGGPSMKVAPCNAPENAVLEIEGKRVAQISHDKKGRLAINFELDITSAQQEALLIQLENFLRRRVMRLPANAAHKRTTDKNTPIADERVIPLDDAKEEMFS